MLIHDFFTECYIRGSTDLGRKKPDACLVSMCVQILPVPLFFSPLSHAHWSVRPGDSQCVLLSSPLCLCASFEGSMKDLSVHIHNGKKEQRWRKELLMDGKRSDGVPVRAGQGAPVSECWELMESIQAGQASLTPLLPIFALSHSLTRRLMKFYKSFLSRRKCPLDIMELLVNADNRICCDVTLLTVSSGFGHKSGIFLMETTSSCFCVCFGWIIQFWKQLNKRIKLSLIREL